MDSQRKIDDFVTLWMAAFKDDENALRWYCKNILHDGEDIVAIYENDICVAVLCIPTVEFCYEGEIVKAGFITGFVINPEYRHNSYELDLVFYSGHYMYAKGYSFVLALPVSPQVNVLYQRRWHMVTGECRRKMRQERGAADESYAGITVEKTKRNIEPEYNAFIKNIYHNYVVHPSAAFDYMSLEGDFFLAKDNQGDVRGIAIRMDYDKDNFVCEFITNSDEATIALTESICKAYDWEHIDYELYDRTANEGIGLIRIGNFQKVLNIYAKSHPHYKDSFNIIDQNCLMNTGSYVIENGECRFMPEDETLRTDSISEIHKLLLSDFNINLKSIY